MKYKYLAIILAIAVVIGLSQLLLEFYDWNRMQSCGTAGGRNCGGGPIPLDR